MKKTLALLMTLCMIFAVCAVSASAEPITLTYAEVNPIEGTVVGDVALAFKEKLEELSGGEILVDIQASGVMAMRRPSCPIFLPATPPWISSAFPPSP